MPRPCPIGSGLGSAPSSRSAHREAVASLEQGLEALAHLTQTRTTLEQAIDLRLQLRSALNVGNVSGATLSALWHTCARLSPAVSLDDPQRLAEVLLFLSRHFSFMSAHDQASAAAQRVLALAPASGDIALRARAVSVWA